MPEYGELRVDYITYTTGTFPSEGKGTVTVSGLINNPTFSGNVIVGNDLTVSGDINASGVTISGITGLFASGTEAAPSISFINDTDTGFYNAAANEVRITTNGNDRLTVDSAGNIGIGTTDPGKLLDVNGDALINTLNIGRGAGNVSSNTALGQNALNSNTTGTNNTALGQNALNSNTTGTNNTAVGLNALRNNTEGGNNTAVGVSALFTNTTGNQNTAVGVSALVNNTTGNQNTAVGRDSLFFNTEGNFNTAVGWRALYTNTTGTNNTALGLSALFSNTTGVNNTAVGQTALFSNTEGDNNTAVGNNALNSNTTGEYNTAVGQSALNKNTDGGSNTALGRFALFNNTEGGSNTAVGQDTLQSNTEGDNNTAVGNGALVANTEGINNTAIGLNALRNNTTGNFNTAVGRTAGFYIEGSNNTILGAYQGTSADATLNSTVIISAGATERLRIDSSGNVGIGTTDPNGILHLKSATPIFIIEDGSGATANLAQTNLLRDNDSYQHQVRSNTGVFTATAYRCDYATNGASAHRFFTGNTQERVRIDSDGNVGIGTTNPGKLLDVNGDALINTLNIGRGAGNISTNTALGISALNSNTTGTQNTAVGVSALVNNTEGENNTAVGRNALRSNTEGVNNTAVGVSALVSNTTGNQNTAFGQSALFNNTTGNDNTAVGQGALFFNTTGDYNTALGRSALLNNTTGTQNTAVGQNALQSNTEGTQNTALGQNALNSNTTGEYNTALGQGALFNNTEGNNNTAVGRSALLNNTTGLGNIGIGGYNSAGAYAPVFNGTTQNDRIVMGSTSVTNAYVQVAWTVTSDARDKTSFAPVPHGLDFVKQLQPTAYQFKAGNRNVRDPETNELIPVTAADELPSGPVRYGFKAQDILALEGDNPVIIDNEDPDHLRYRGEALVPIIVNAIKEQQVLIDALTARLDAAGL